MEYGDLNYSAEQINNMLRKAVTFDICPLEVENLLYKYLVEGASLSDYTSEELKIIFDSVTLESYNVSKFNDDALTSIIPNLNIVKVSSEGIETIALKMSVLQIVTTIPVYDSVLILISLENGEYKLTLSRKVLGIAADQNNKDLSISSSTDILSDGDEFVFSSSLDLKKSGDGSKFLADNGEYKSVSGGGGSASIPVVVVEGATPTQELQPNTYYEFGEVTELNITLAAELPNIYNEYMFEFTSGATPTTLSLPSDIKWIGDEAPVIEANKKYQVSVVNGVGAVGKVDNSMILEIELRWNLQGGNPYLFSIDGKSYTSENSTAVYSVGSVINIQSNSPYYSAIAEVYYMDGSSDSAVSTGFGNTASLNIEKEVEYISITQNGGGGGGGA